MAKTMAEWFGERLDERLARLSDNDAKRAFLEKTRAVQNQKSQRWLASDFREYGRHPQFGELTVHDWFSMMAEITDRLAQLDARAAA